MIDQGQQYAASGRDVLIDPVDRLSLNLFIGGDNCISMAVRLSWADDIVATEYLATLRNNLPDDIAPKRTIICSRLMASTAKHGELARLVVLFRRGFEIGLTSGCTHSVLSTLPHRIPLFEKFGYRRTGIRIEDHVAGPQEILFLDVNDQRHLESVGSPFAPVRSKLRAISKVEKPAALHPVG